MSSNLIARSRFLFLIPIKSLKSKNFLSLSNLFNPIFGLENCQNLGYKMPWLDLLMVIDTSANGRDGTTNTGTFRAGCSPSMRARQSASRSARNRATSPASAGMNRSKPMTAIGLGSSSPLTWKKPGQTMDTAHTRKRREIAKACAMAAGCTYRPVDHLADTSQIEDIVRRLLTVEQQNASDGRLNEAVVDAVPGWCQRTEGNRLGSDGHLQDEDRAWRVAQQVAGSEEALTRHKGSVASVFRRSDWQPADCRHHARARPGLFRLVEPAASAR